MAKSKIEWTDATWNPIRARHRATGAIGWHCEHVSEACRHCYAERQNLNRRHLAFGTELPYAPASMDEIELFLDEKVLHQPLHWRQPRKIFVCSMTDLFGHWVADHWIDEILAIAALCPQHTFMLLTKRPERAAAHSNDRLMPRRVYTRAAEIGGQRDRDDPTPQAVPVWPLHNVMYGATVENQGAAETRLPFLLATHAARLWVSAEPTLGPINFTQIRDPATGDEINALRNVSRPIAKNINVNDEPWMVEITDLEYSLPSLQLVITGGETGPDSRPCHPDLFRAIRDQCIAFGVAYFHKQNGDYSWMELMPDDGTGEPWRRKQDGERICLFKELGLPRESLPPIIFTRSSKAKTGRLLDGREWNQFPGEERS